MDVQTIQMDPHEAGVRLLEYRSALKKRANVEYEAAAAGYQALAKGTPLLILGDVLRAAPVDEKGRPMLAVARADRLQVLFEGRPSTMSFSTLMRSTHHYEGDLFLRFPTDTAPSYRSGWALVPMVPPAAAAAAGGTSKLREHLILWEVEKWADRPIKAVPDRDPMLLKRITGDLCAVVAHWDLTDLEMAVMTGRATGASRS